MIEWRGGCIRHSNQTTSPPMHGRFQTPAMPDPACRCAGCLAAAASAECPFFALWAHGIWAWVRTQVRSSMQKRVEAAGTVFDRPRIHNVAVVCTDVRDASVYSYPSASVLLPMARVHVRYCKCPPYRPTGLFRWRRELCDAFDCLCDLVSVYHRWQTP